MSKEEAIVQLAKVFRQYGYEGSTLARLSQATGLGKASLYHYFPGGKEEMAAVVLDRMKHRFDEHVLQPLRDRGNPTERIHAMVKHLDEFYDRGHNTCLLAVLAIGEANDLFRLQIQTAFNIWIDTLAKVLIEAGLDAERAYRKAEEAVLKIQGALVLSRGLNNTAAFERVIQHLPEELL